MGQRGIERPLPDDYVFQGSKSAQLKLVGVVPPGLARAVAEALAGDLAEMRAAVTDGG